MIDPDIHYKIMARAGNRCECENTHGKCPHAPAMCPLPHSADSEIIMPENTPMQQQFSNGRYVCAECFDKSRASITKIIDKWTR